MASFPPLKNYILYCIDQMINQYGLKPPFLDVGCGIGDASLHLAKKGWNGKAIDVSKPAIEAALNLLQPFPAIVVEKKSLFDEREPFQLIIALDMLEHLEEDAEALNKISSLTNHGGYLIAAVPSNPHEWRWDDNYFEHVRRYTEEEFRSKLAQAKFEPVVVWDFTYPVFWAMRRLYTWIKKAPKHSAADKQKRIEMCPLLQTWKIPIISDLLSKKSFLWDLIYKWQFKYFKYRLSKGHEMIVLAKKTS